MTYPQRRRLYVQSWKLVRLSKWSPKLQKHTCCTKPSPTELFRPLLVPCDLDGGAQCSSVSHERSPVTSKKLQTFFWSLCIRLRNCQNTATVSQFRLVYWLHLVPRGMYYNMPAFIRQFLVCFYRESDAKFLHDASSIQLVCTPTMSLVTASAPGCFLASLPLLPIYLLAYIYVICNCWCLGNFEISNKLKEKIYMSHSVGESGAPC